MRSSRSASPNCPAACRPQGRRRHRGGAQEKKHRIEDAGRTTKAAIEEGVVAGGGVTLLRAQAGIADAGQTKLEKAARRGHPAPPHRPGPRGPLKQIAENAGLEGGVVVEKERELEVPSEA